MKPDEMELLRQYAVGRSESAFAALVTNHSGLVYSVALRLVCDRQLAEEVTQAVFIILARKAASLKRGTVLAGWLYKTTHYASQSALRQEHRRRTKEQEAYMRSTLNSAEPQTTWDQISPYLEETMLRLRQRDREALILRFYEGRNFGEVAAVMGSTEEAVRKRVNRALDKLRRSFSRRGFSSATGIIAAAISANCVQAAPPALVTSISATATSAARAGTTTLSVAKGALKLMTWAKAKTVAATTAGLLLFGGTVAVLSDRQPSYGGHTATFWALAYKGKPYHFGTMNYHFFMPFSEWPAVTQQKEPELAALIRIGLPAVPDLVRLRDQGSGDRLQRLYWRFWKSIPAGMQKRLTPPKENNTQWKMEMTELICMELLCHRNDPGAARVMRPLFDEAMKVARSGDFRDGTHFNILAVATLDESAAENVLLKQMRARNVIFQFETACAAAALPNPSDEICDELLAWTDRNRGPMQREIAFEALGYLSRRHARLRDALWRKFLEVDPADQEFWMAGIALQVYPQELTDRMVSAVERWLRDTDPSKSRIRERWQAFLAAQRRQRDQ
jgi:RNA polymerase sigma factor (sigma-70 family)